MVRLFFRLLSFVSWLRGPSLTTGFGLFRIRHPLRVFYCSFVSSSPPGTQHSTCRVGDLPGAEGCPLSALFVSCVLIQLTQRRPFSIPSTFWGFILLWQFSSRNGSLLWELGIWKSVGVLPESKQQRKACSACGFIGIWYKEGRLFWGELATLVFPKSRAAASLCERGETPELLHLQVSRGLARDTKASLYAVLLFYEIMCLLSSPGCREMWLLIPFVLPARTHCQWRDFTACLLVYRVCLRPKFLAVPPSCQ